MEKQKLISELKSAISQGQITKDEILKEFSSDSVIKRLNLSEVFYYIGGVIVLLGLIVLIGQNWVSFSYGLQILVTFGVGLAFFISASLLQKTEQVKNLSTVFYFLSGALIPFGYFVIFKDSISDSTFDFYNTLIPFLCLLQFGLTQFVLKKDVFTIFNTIFATWFFFSLSNHLMDANPDRFNANFHSYQIILVGISYTLIAYYLKVKGRLFSNWLNLLGTLGILGVGFHLNFLASGFYGPEASVIWLILYPLMLIASIVSSIYLKNSAFLFVGTLFLIAYLMRITGQYFSAVLGWPIALIVMGIVIMVLGYLAFHLNKKYIK